MNYMLKIDPELHKKVKVAAAQTGTTIREITVKALEEMLEREESRKEEKKCQEKQIKD
jgi:hypothetical protein